MKKKISIHDIARQLNVSSATVSFVLNGKASEMRISSALEKKILAYVEKIGYRPNMVAKSLRTGKSKIIGMLVEGIADPFFAGIARVVEEKAYKLGYKILYASTENDTSITRDLINVFRDMQVDGYIIAPPPGIEKDIQSLLDDHLPVVLFDRFFPGLETHNVIIDNLGGAYDAIQHFVQQGYRQIGMVTLSSTQSQMIDRLNGYKKAARKNGLKTYIEKIPFESTHDKTLAQIKSFLLRNNQLEAVLFATNYLAIQGLEVLNELKMTVPDDIAVIGFDDNTHFSLFSPSITAVAQPVQEISEQVISQLMGCLSNKEKIATRQTVVLPAKLNVRESSLQASAVKRLQPA